MKCNKCLDKGYILYGEETMAGQEKIICDCVKNPAGNKPSLIKNEKIKPKKR